MNEIERLTAVLIDDHITEPVKQIMEVRHGTDLNLWLLFCVYCNKYTIWDGVNYKFQESNRESSKDRSR